MISQVKILRLSSKENKMLFRRRKVNNSASQIKNTLGSILHSLKIGG